MIVVSTSIVEIFLFSFFIYFCSMGHSLSISPRQVTLDRPLIPQPSWRLIIKKDTVCVVDVLSIIGRFSRRQDFYLGENYERPADGLLTCSKFYEALKNRKFERWPKLENGGLIGADGLTEDELTRWKTKLESEPSRSGAEAVFTAFAKGAGNGVVYPVQVDEEMAKFLSTDGIFNLAKFEEALFWGRLNVLIGWFLYIGLQFGGIYVVFFAPIMSYFFPGKPAL